MGLRIEGKISGNQALIDAQFVGYINITLFFQATTTASAGLSALETFVYRYSL